MRLPFLKNQRIPRIAPDMEEKLVNGSPSDHLQDHCIGELMEAAKSKDVSKFRSAMEALVCDMFDLDGEY